MKKIYAFLAAAIMAGSAASAQSLFFKGSGDGLSWDEGNDLEVTIADGKYTVSITNLSSFKVSSIPSNDGWGTFNEGALYAPGCDEIANLGKALATEINGGPNNNVPYVGDYTIVIAGDLSTMTLTTTTPKPEGFTAVYLRGDMNNWLNDASDETKALWEMKTLDGVKYAIDCQGPTMIPAGTAFKIADANWGSINYTLGDEVFPFDDYLDWYYNNPSNSVMSEDYTGTIVLNLVNGKGQDAQVMVAESILEDPFGAVAGIAADNAPAEYFNLQGIRVAEPATGLYIVRQGTKVSKVLVK